MENQNKEMSHQTKLYFLQQGTRIVKLHQLLNSNLLLHHLQKWLSVGIELLLYFTFLAILMLVIFMPIDISYYFSFNDLVGFNLEYRNKDFEMLIICVKVLLLLLSLPALVLARVLARSRKKSQLILRAFKEVTEMKTDFDIALRDLKF